MDAVSYALSKKYVEDTANGLGAVKGSPATVQNIERVAGGNNVTFAWTGIDGTIQTQVMFVADGSTEEVDLSNYLTKEEANLDQYLTKKEADLEKYLTSQSAQQTYQPKGNYITEHQTLKTINGQSIVGTGNITVQGGKHLDVVADFKADVYMIPCYGQSLAINTSAGTSTFTYTEPLAYDVNLKNSNVQDMCAGTAEAFRIMADYYGISIPENFKVIVCADGGGGKSVSQLSKGTSYYTSLINHVKTAKASCDAKGLKMIVPCFTWTQGEEEMRCGGTTSNYGYGNWNPHTYKDRLKELIESLNADIKAITGQTEDVLCISYQLTAHTSYSRYPRIAFQLEELAEEYDKMILAKVMYDLEYVTEGTSQVHAYARSYRNIGNLYGIAAFRACVLNERKRWCYPINYTIRGNKVIIQFDTPFRPLALDTELINQLPDGNYGFNVYNVDEQNGAAGSIAEAETRVTNVQLRGDDTVEITLSRTPVEGETLTYGVNGDYWQNVAGSKAVLTGGEGPDGYSKAGWQYGARGCLRDSQPFKNNYGGAVFHNLYNWCVLFEIPFTSENLGSGTSGGDDSGDSEPTETFTFTVNPTPSDAVVVLNGKEAKSVDVVSGTTVEWSVTAEGYTSQSGSQVVDADVTIDVTLNALNKYTVTINTVPEDALAIIEDDEIKTVELYEGTVVDWVVSKEGYITQTGSFTLTEDTTMTVKLVGLDDMDTDAYAYLNAANITDETQTEKINTMVTSLKSEGLWDKIDALYPMIGSTFEQMSYNLKDPAAYQLRTTGTPTIVADTSMACSKQIVSDVPATLPGSDFHIMGSSVTKVSETSSKLLAVGPSSGGGFDASKGGVMLLISASSVSVRTTTSDRWVASTAIDGDGLAIASLTSGIVYNGADLGATKSGTPSVTKWTTFDNNTFQYNCYNSSATAGKVENPFTTRIAGFGKGLTIEEMQKYSEILNSFKTMY